MPVSGAAVLYRIAPEPGASVGAGRQAETAAEFAVHMALIDVTAGGCDLSGGETFHEQSAAEVGAALHAVGMGREAGVALEGADQLKAAEAGFARKVREIGKACRILVQALANTGKAGGQGRRFLPATKQRLSENEDEHFLQGVRRQVFRSMVKPAMQGREMMANISVSEDGQLEFQVRDR
jgi:hypothetical protein